ncbi:hypothetical protein P175DRAFT_0429358 [Aspergillus ochraceoroseus IBT 24754]|uniref:Uncharacterized protein n=1 Tax=Aspergillus ochraceoroseus IBT 24754 TaxID=1392256 RepID=A0A2T5M9Q6_9EURO|nr:uncharacterized protein P175DRAFT_0429358 [Aspergillus ochraceoroseus IBT 24754]PTU25245.1 hypothetical protein P175DRAFT_0429358 [Aspergillus ochraceoroseus IBT 24754]
MSYSRFVAAQRHNNPCLAGLENFLSDPNSDQRPCRILKLDFPVDTKSPHLSSAQQIDIEDIAETIYASKPKGHGQILFIEDLCPDIIEILGTRYQIDPLFFASHLHAPFRQIDAQTPNLAILPSRTRKQNFINLHYHRAVELRGKVENENMLIRDMNVNRKVAVLVPTEGTQIALVQHACSVIVSKVNRMVLLGIILVDGPIFADHTPVQYKTKPQEFSDDKELQLRRSCRVKSKLFLNGYEDFMPPEPGSLDFKDPSAFRGPPRESLLADLIYYWKRQIPEDFNAEHPTLFSLAYYPLKIIAAEWNNYLAAMSYHIKRHEYAVETIGKPVSELDKLNVDLRSLQVWRRRSLASQQKITAVKRFVALHHVACETPATGLLEDYDHLAAALDDLSFRLGNMLPVVTSLVQISDSRRSLAESANVSRLTSLAFIFVPLTFTTGLFSMNNENGPGGAYFWVFFAVSVPITLLVFLVARPPSRLLRWLSARVRPALRAAYPPV